MAKRVNRVDTSQRRDGLTNQPFAALDDVNRDALPPGPAELPAGKSTAVPTPDYRVMRTRKGGWPLRVEKRAAGKVVTIIANVEGDTTLLLAALRKRCGSGGVARPGLVEVQGDHRARIEAFLNDL